MRAKRLDVSALMFSLLFSTSLLAQQPTLLVDFMPGSASSTANRVLDYQDELYYVGNYPLTVGANTFPIEGLIKTDGTASGTNLIVDLDFYDPSMEMFAQNDLIYAIYSDFGGDLLLEINPSDASVNELDMLSEFDNDFFIHTDNGTLIKTKHVSSERYLYLFRSAQEGFIDLGEFTESEFDLKLSTYGEDIIVSKDQITDNYRPQIVDTSNGTLKSLFDAISVQFALTDYSNLGFAKVVENILYLDLIGDGSLGNNPLISIDLATNVVTNLSSQLANSDFRDVLIIDNNTVLITSRSVYQLVGGVVTDLFPAVSNVAQSLSDYRYNDQSLIMQANVDGLDRIYLTDGTLALSQLALENADGLNLATQTSTNSAIHFLMERGFSSRYDWYSFDKSTLSTTFTSDAFTEVELLSEVIFKGIGDQVLFAGFTPATGEELYALSQAVDADNDGFSSDVDCDDTNAEVNPDATELAYNGIDDDCDPATLDDDLDQDGFLFADDCDDTNPDINPNATEIAGNGIDEDCDGMDQPSSTQELDGNTITLYPVPVRAMLNIQMSIDAALNFSIFNKLGQEVSTGKLSRSIDMSGLSAGQYIIRLINTNTGNQITYKIIKA